MMEINKINIADAFELMKLYMSRNPTANLVQAAKWAQDIQDSDKTELTYAEISPDGKVINLRDYIEKLKEELNDNSGNWS